MSFSAIIAGYLSLMPWKLGRSFHCCDQCSHAAGGLQTSISPPPASEQTKGTSQHPLPKWLQEAANPQKSFKPPTLTRDSSTEFPSHIAYSNKDLDRLVYSVSQDELTADRLSDIHQWLLDVNHAFDSRLCTSFITAFVRIRQPAAALSIFFWMIGEVEKGRPELAPTVHTYTAGIQAATAARVFSQASIIWKHAQGARIRGDEQLTCTYMAALFQAACYSQVLQLFDSLHNRAQTAPAHAYVLAIRAHTKLGESCQALELWDEMQEKLKPNVTGVPCSNFCDHGRAIMAPYRCLCDFTCVLDTNCVSFNMQAMDIQLRSQPVRTQRTPTWRMKYSAR